MEKKDRIIISDDVSAQILFESDRTCCVCNIKGKTVQVHHIDENPANNNPNNLAVLCLECHSETQIKGGFGRKLNASQVRLYQSEWTKRVKNRKEKADELASLRTLTTEDTALEEDSKSISYQTNSDPDQLKNYLYKVAELKRTVYKYARAKWDTGVTTTMRQGTYDVIDFYEEILIELSTFYPSNHFEANDIKKYFNDLIASRYRWHWLINEVNGQGQSGTIIYVIVGGSVMDDIDTMVKDMVISLDSKYGFNYKEWLKLWGRASKKIWGELEYDE